MNGDELFDQVTDPVRSHPGVTEGRMLQNPGLRVDGQMFAFLGFDGDLIVKLPRERAEAAVADGAAEPVTMGQRTMREWVAFPYAADGAETWPTVLAEAEAYGRTLAAAKG